VTAAIDRWPKVGFLDLLQRRAERGGYRTRPTVVGSRDAIDDVLDLGAIGAAPVGQRRQIVRWSAEAALLNIADTTGLFFTQIDKKRRNFSTASMSFLPLVHIAKAIIVLEALRRPEAVQCVRHSVAPTVARRGPRDW
jgi:hypothetical protein